MDNHKCRSIAGDSVKSRIYTKKAPQINERLCTTYGIRTRDSSVKGRRLNPLTNAAFPLKDGKDNAWQFFNQII